MKLTYMGDARYNMGNSLMVACSKLGLDFTACTRKEYFPNPQLVEECQAYAKASVSTITLTEDVREERAGRMSSTPMYGSPWASRTVSGRRESTPFFRTR